MFWKKKDQWEKSKKLSAKPSDRRLGANDLFTLAGINDLGDMPHVLDRGELIAFCKSRNLKVYQAGDRFEFQPEQSLLVIEDGQLLLIQAEWLDLQKTSLIVEV